MSVHFSFFKKKCTNRARSEAARGHWPAYRRKRGRASHRSRPFEASPRRGPRTWPPTTVSARGSGERTRGAPTRRPPPVAPPCPDAARQRRASTRATTRTQAWVGTLGFEGSGQKLHTQPKSSHALISGEGRTRTPFKRVHPRAKKKNNNARLTQRPYLEILRVRN